MQQAAYSRFDGDDAGNRQGTLPIRGTYAAAPRGDDGSSAETHSFAIDPGRRRPLRRR